VDTLRDNITNIIPLYVSDEEAVKLIEADVVTNRKKDKSQWNEVDMGSILFSPRILCARMCSPTSPQNPVMVFSFNPHQINFLDFVGISHWEQIENP
jgi:hypothetical protein